MSVTNQHSKELNYKPTLSWQMIQKFLPENLSNYFNSMFNHCTQ